jgi:hypothetical protein
MVHRRHHKIDRIEHGPDNSSESEPDHNGDNECAPKMMRQCSGFEPMTDALAPDVIACGVVAMLDMSRAHAILT